MHKNLSIQDLRMFSLFSNLRDEDLGRILEDVRKWALEKDEVLLLRGRHIRLALFCFFGMVEG